MNATMVASGTKAVSPVVSSIQDIPFVKIRESKTNPRRFFDEAKRALYEDKLTVTDAFEIARLHPTVRRLLLSLKGLGVMACGGAWLKAFALAEKLGRAPKRTTEFAQSDCPSNCYRHRGYPS